MMESMNINGVPHNFPSISGNNVGNGSNNMNGHISGNMNSHNQKSLYFDMFSLPLSDFQK